MRRKRAAKGVCERRLPGFGRRSLRLGRGCRGWARRKKRKEKDGHRGKKEIIVKRKKK